jgi:hypothetical protein
MRAHSEVLCRFPGAIQDACESPWPGTAWERPATGAALVHPLPGRCVTNAPGPSARERSRESIGTLLESDMDEDATGCLGLMGPADVALSRKASCNGVPHPSGKVSRRLRAESCSSRRRSARCVRGSSCSPVRKAACADRIGSTTSWCL